MNENFEGLKIIRKRVEPTLENFKNIYGCYVSGGQVAANFTIPILDMSDEEKEMYAKLLKKCISGKPDKNLLSIEMDENENQKSLYALSKNQLNDFSKRDVLYNTIRDNLELDKNYCILLAADTIDTEETEFSYFLCGICPIKETKAELRYNKKEFRSNSTGSILSNPILGFSYPAFIDDAADIFTGIYYFTKEVHKELIDGVFAGEVPKTAEEQKEEFQDALAESLEEDYTLETTALLQAKISALRDEKESLMMNDIKEALSNVVEQNKLESAEDNLGKGYECNLENLEEKKFTVETTSTTIITEDPVSLKIKEIDGRKYILVPASGVTVNGKEVTT